MNVENSLFNALKTMTSMSTIDDGLLLGFLRCGSSSSLESVCLWRENLKSCQNLFVTDVLPKGNLNLSIRINAEKNSMMRRI